MTTPLSKSAMELFCNALAEGMSIAVHKATKEELEQFVDERVNEKGMELAEKLGSYESE